MPACTKGTSSNLKKSAWARSMRLRWPSTVARASSWRMRTSVRMVTTSLGGASRSLEAAPLWPGLPLGAAPAGPGAHSASRRRESSGRVAKRRVAACTTTPGASSYLAAMAAARLARVLPAPAPPAASIACALKTRLYLASRSSSMVLASSAKEPPLAARERALSSACVATRRSAGLRPGASSCPPRSDATLSIRLDPPPLAASARSQRRARSRTMACASADTAGSSSRRASSSSEAKRKTPACASTSPSNLAASCCTRS
mmetsp:Transcript_10024/g.29509  ORF Transcript_10024/g.29509 Transcript_10024/m.29509 type:complete len:260 (-) Transcript_10024:810-1589(-)